MSEHGPHGEGCTCPSASLVMNTIVVETYLTDDGTIGQHIKVNDGITVLEALGMLEYAKQQVLTANVDTG